MGSGEWYKQERRDKVPNEWVDALESMMERQMKIQVQLCLEQKWRQDWGNETPQKYPALLSNQTPHE